MNENTRFKDLRTLTENQEKNKIKIQLNSKNNPIKIKQKSASLFQRNSILKIRSGDKLKKSKGKSRALIRSKSKEISVLKRSEFLEFCSFKEKFNVKKLNSLNAKNY
jgi:hypothetical protein